MRERYTDFVIPTLAQHLGVPAREIAATHDLRRDWGFTPLQLVVILLELERIVAIELPSHELCSVKTVADLSNKLRGWVRASAADPGPGAFARRRARRSRHALRERRIRRELHFLRWLERNETARSVPRMRALAERREARISP
jgi:acyl carrier protein